LRLRFFAALEDIAQALHGRHIIAVDKFGDRRAFDIVGTAGKPVPARTGMQDAPVTVELKHSLFQNGQGFPVSALFGVSFLHPLHHVFQRVRNVIDFVMRSVRGGQQR